MSSFIRKRTGWNFTLSFVIFFEELKKARQYARLHKMNIYCYSVSRVSSVRGR